MKKCCVDTQADVSSDYEKRIKELESALQEFVDHSGKPGAIAYAYHFVQICKQLLKKA